MIHLAVLGWLWHPLGACPAGPTYEACRSYNFWSGIEGNLAYIVPMALFAFGVWRTVHRHLECHAEGCRRIGWHRVENTHYRTCWRDHPVLSQHPHHSVPLAAIHQAHEEGVAGAVKVTEGGG